MGFQQDLACCKAGREHGGVSTELLTINVCVRVFVCRFPMFLPPFQQVRTCAGCSLSLVLKLTFTYSSLIHTRSCHQYVPCVQ